MTQLSPQEQQLKVVNRLIAVREARDDLISYLRLTMPDSDDPDDVTKSRFIVTPQAKLLCEVMEKVEHGKLKRVCVSIGPQMGKSQIISRGAPAWSIGRRPTLNQILGSYNQDFANEFGFEVRNLIESNTHAQVFPEAELMKGGKAKDLLMTTAGGKSAFVGVGGSGTGKPADRFVVDDPYRNAEDANSEVFREQVWRWFNGVVFSRCHDGSAIVIVHTRWHQDDLIGRLCDPTHPERQGRFKGLERGWTYINLPAVVEDPKLAAALGLTLEVPSKTKFPNSTKELDHDPELQGMVIEQFGDKPMSALWPGRKSLPLMAEAKRMDPYVFNSLYMGSPAPDDGDYFKKEQLVEYDVHQLPTNLRKYGASDHAVSAKARRDYTVIGCVGIDEQDDIWVLPDLIWERIETDRTVEELIQKFKIHHPMLWWMEDEMISKAFGPFLIKRMHEEKVYTTTLDPIRPAKDLRTRARSIQGRMQMRKVHFPKFAPWWPKARGQMLMFNGLGGGFDDFVSFMSLIGLGLTKELKPPTISDTPKAVSGTINWMLADTNRRAVSERKKAVW